MSRRVLILCALASLAACRAKQGERCVCAGDCASGLVCVIEGGNVLESGACAPNGSAGGGMCLPAGASGDDSSGVLTDAPLFMDLGSKRDFDPAPATTTATGTGSTGTGTATSTGTTGTGTATGATSSATGATATGTTGSGSGATSATSTGSGG